MYFLLQNGLPLAGPFPAFLPSLTYHRSFLPPLCFGSETLLGPDCKAADGHPPVPLSPAVWCSAAVDVLFLIDGSHSIGKGSFERAKHFAITVCATLDINPERVSASLAVSVFRMSLAASDRNPVLSRRGHYWLVEVERTRG